MRILHCWCKWVDRIGRSAIYRETGALDRRPGPAGTGRRRGAAGPERRNHAGANNVNEH